jgi:hypothetical protein
MKKSIEEKIRLTALKQTPPPPTLLKKPDSANEDLMGGGGGETFDICGVSIPARMDYSYTIRTAYDWIITSMYCQPNPLGLEYGCTPVYAGPPLGSVVGVGQVTDRDEPLTWIRSHPEFNPTDPATWGSVWGPGGLAERFVRYLNCQMGEDGVYGTGPCGNITDAQINEMVDLLKQLWVRKCGFAVSQAGACCSVVGDFGGFACTEVAGTANCQGTFYPGQSCQQIGGDNCGLAPNPLQKNNQAKKQKEVMEAVMSILKVR